MRELVLTLSQDSTHSIVGCVAHDLKGKRPIGRLHNGGGG